MCQTGSPCTTKKTIECGGWFVFSSGVCPAVALECAAGSNRLGVLFCCCCSHGWFFLRTKVGKRHSFLVTAATECQNRQGARARKGGWGGKLGHNKQTREVWRKERGITRQCENWLVGWLDRLVRLEMSGRGKSAPTRLTVWAARDKGVKTLWKGDIYAWFVCCLFFFAKGEKRPFADALQIGGTKTKGALFFFSSSSSSFLSFLSLVLHSTLWLHRPFQHAPLLGTLHQGGGKW
eukprot:TRINITY_DN8025_c1_g1_i1.p1 TRINITY_DN8025_c1_g1~~TRINITY_DN8025_c1_g1_i1.p1  ORF type:complete len:235 (-),score=5.94 TRINITY_DN8025_c1_g1_i1:639-1343(-)